MKIRKTRLIIGILFSVWIGGMLYFFTNNSQIHAVSKEERDRHVALGKLARERDHFSHNEVAIARDPNIRNSLEKTDTRSLDNFDWQRYIKAAGLKDGEDKNQRNAYNQEASDALAWDRDVPDVRDNRYVYMFDIYPFHELP